jgi:hypothetical protein
VLEVAQCANSENVVILSEAKDLCSVCLRG